MHYSQLPLDPQTNILHPNSCVPCSNQPTNCCPATMQPPVCTACTSALYNQSATEITVNDEAAIPLTNVTTVGTDLTYDVNTGLITVNRPGVYLFLWNLLAEPAAAEVNTPLVFTLENTAGQVYALSADTYITAHEAPVNVSGTAVRQLAAGTNVALYNRSGVTVSLVPVVSASGLAFSGSLTVVKIC